MAKRLAWAMIGEKNSERIKFTQFHQSTTYDDFVIGFRPKTDGGFSITEGQFVRFAKQAAVDKDNKYFFVIDEINRANISKVFGELLMLIEADHRDEAVTLTVSGEEFSVPENLYIIGMMNTADRGLALIDYALRRRFAFFNIQPAFDNPTFKDSLKAGSSLEKLARAVEKLNQTIKTDPSLGPGFQIGHSYFCVENPSSDTARSIYFYELKPLIEEYWFDNPEKVKEESRKLEEALL